MRVVEQSLEVSRGYTFGHAQRLASVSHLVYSSWQVGGNELWQVLFTAMYSTQRVVLWCWACAVSLKLHTWCLDHVASTRVKLVKLMSTHAMPQTNEHLSVLPPPPVHLLPLPSVPDMLDTPALVCPCQGRGSCTDNSFPPGSLALWFPPHPSVIDVGDIKQ